MSSIAISRMKIFHEMRLLGKAFAALAMRHRRSSERRRSARRGEAQDTGESDRNWQRLLQTSDFWRYL
jgi:hypothetical protein